jgi:hypothetical protein
LQHRDSRGVAGHLHHVDLAGTIFGEKKFAVGGAHAVRPLDRLVQPDIYRFAGLAAGVHWYAIQLVENDVVLIQRVADEGDAVYAEQRLIIAEQLRNGSAGLEAPYLRAGGVAYVQRLVRSDHEVVA